MPNQSWDMPQIMQLLEQLRRRRPADMQHMGGPRMGLGGTPRMNGGGNGMGMGFAGGKPGEMGGWGQGFKPSFGPPQEMVPTPEMSPVDGQWNDGGAWGPPSMSMGQRDAPMPAPPQEMPQMGQRPAPAIMRLLGAMQGMKRPKGRGGW